MSLTQLVASGEKQVCLSNIMQVELNSNFYHVSGYYILWNSSVSDIKIFVIWIFILVVSYWTFVCFGCLFANFLLKFLSFLPPPPHTHTHPTPQTHLCHHHATILNVMTPPPLQSNTVLVLLTFLEACVVLEKKAHLTLTHHAVKKSVNVQSCDTRPECFQRNELVNRQCHIWAST